MGLNIVSAICSVVGIILFTVDMCFNPLNFYPDYYPYWEMVSIPCNQCSSNAKEGSPQKRESSGQSPFTHSILKIRIDKPLFGAYHVPFYFDIYYLMSLESRW